VRKLVYYIAATVDGFIAGPDGADPTGPDGFWPVPDDYLSHIIARYPETLPHPARQALGVTAEGTLFDTVLEGRHSYELGLKVGLTDAYPHLRHLVFSRAMADSPDPAVEILSADPVGAVRELKRHDGKDIWVIGGGTLAGALYPEIDQLIVKLAPVTVGAGIPLFGNDAVFQPRAWHLTGHTVLDSGALFLTYDRTTSGQEPA
jgi:dihydrofolate reductase